MVAERERKSPNSVDAQVELDGQFLQWFRNLTTCKMECGADA